MFLRFTRRLKDGKEHRYWSVVENKRCAGGKVVQRPVLYLGEINDHQIEDWCRVIEAFDEGSHSVTSSLLCSRLIARFPNTLRPTACKCGLMPWNCIDRDNGALAGWRVSSMSNLGSMTFGKAVCWTPAKAPAGGTFCKHWCAIG